MAEVKDYAGILRRIIEHYAQFKSPEMRKLTDFAVA